MKGTFCAEHLRLGLIRWEKRKQKRSAARCEPHSLCCYRCGNLLDFLKYKVY